MKRLTLFMFFMLGVFIVLVNSPPVSATDTPPTLSDITSDDVILVQNDFSLIAEQQEVPYIREGEYTLRYVYANSAILYNSFAPQFTGPITLLMYTRPEVTIRNRHYTELGYSLAY